MGIAENFAPANLVCLQNGLDIEVLFAKKHILVDDRLLLNHVMHGYYIDTRSQLTVVNGKVTS